MRSYSILYLLTLWSTGALALPGSVHTTLSVPKPYPSLHPCPKILCPNGKGPEWDPVTSTCRCKSEPLPPVDCSDMMCISEKHVVYDKETGTCGCEWIPGFGPTLARSVASTPNEVDPKTCPLMKCKVGYHAFYNEALKKCTCQEDRPDPSTCPTIKCASSTHPVYHPETKSCSCDPNSPTCSNDLFCASGCHTVQDPSSKGCICEVTNPIPKTCPQFKCTADYHVVYHPETKKCGCEPSCPDLFCISEQHPTMDWSTNTCSCQYINGLESSPLIEARAETTRPTSHPSCSKLFCISEMRPTYNETSKHCECEWIPGFGPGKSMTRRPTTTNSSPPVSKPTPACGDTICISEMRPAYDTTSKSCGCEWIPGLKPSLVDVPVTS